MNFVYLKTKGRFHFLTFMLILLSTVCIYMVAPASADASDSTPNVLIINSYHKGFTWSDNEVDGIVSVLKDSGLTPSIFIEYIDWKNYPYQDNLDNIYREMMFKYSSKKFDAVIVTDDTALEFSLKNRSSIFPDSPIVFCGILKESLPKLIKQNSNITGVIEEPDPKTTIEMALKINPSLKNVYVIFDNTETGQPTGNAAIEAINSIGASLDCKPLSNLTFSALLEKVRNLEKDSVVLLTSYVRDSEGKTIEAEDACQAISENSSVPVYHLYDLVMGKGTIGGSLLSGRLQGENAAKLALRILKGESAASIPFWYEKTTRKIFDYNQLKRFNIPLAQLPNNVEIINKPFSFVETYKTLVYCVAGAFLMLLAFISILMIYMRKLKKAEENLREINTKLIRTYEDLEAAHEELTASEEELRQQFDELQTSQEQLRVSEERFRLAVEGSNDAIWESDFGSNKVFLSERGYELLGYDVSEYDNVMNTWFSLVHPDDVNRMSKERQAHIESKTPFYDCEYRVRAKSGEYRWVRARGKALRDYTGNVVKIAGSITDITDQRSIKERIHRLAYYDTLTGLPNRTSLYETLTSLFVTGGEILSEYSLLFIDVDNFKTINDTYGHTVGDKLLIEVSNRICSSIDKQNFIARLGGDEFIILDTRLYSDAYSLAETVLNVLQKPFDIDSNVFHVSASIGIAVYPRDGTNIEELLKNADTAMYKAKSTGKKNYKIFDRTMNEEVYEKITLENKMRAAIDNNEFCLYYQPQIDVEKGSICGFEALVRWFDPKSGLISPMKFISIAEDTGLIVPIGALVLKKACLFIKEVHDIGYDKLYISVNVSIIQLMHDSFIETVLKVLDETGLSPEFLELEITESILIESFESNVNKLSILKAKGIKISLDDFGKGYSSLNYLKQLPINTLKIDKVFIDDITNNENSDSIIDSIISIGHKMGLDVVAEGVETTEQYIYLSNNKCNKVQGYLFFKPVPENEAIEILRTHNGL